MRMAKKKITLEILAARMQKGFAAVNGRITKGFASADKKFEALAGLVEKGFAAVAEDISKLATKEDLAAVEKRLDDRIDGAIVKIDGVQNTLDAQTLVRADQQLPERVSAIEKHLGMSKNIAA